MVERTHARPTRPNRSPHILYPARLSASGTRPVIVTCSRPRAHYICITPPLHLRLLRSRICFDRLYPWKNYSIVLAYLVVYVYIYLITLTFHFCRRSCFRFAVGWAYTCLSNATVWPKQDLMCRYFYSHSVTYTRVGEIAMTIYK